MSQQERPHREVAWMLFFFVPLNDHATLCTSSHLGAQIPHLHSQAVGGLGTIFSEGPFRFTIPQMQFFTGSKKGAVSSAKVIAENHGEDWRRGQCTSLGGCVTELSPKTTWIVKSSVLLVALTCCPRNLYYSASAVGYTQIPKSRT